MAHRGFQRSGMKTFLPGEPRSLRRGRERGAAASMLPQAPFLSVDEDSRCRRVACAEAADRGKAWHSTRPESCSRGVGKRYDRRRGAQT